VRYASSLRLLAILVPEDREHATLGRIIYMRGYMADPSKRLVGAMMGGLTSIALFIVAAIGVVKACLALRVM
jgi:hypothetical protein